MEIKLDIQLLQKIVADGRIKDFSMFLYYRKKCSNKKFQFMGYTPDRFSEFVKSSRNTSESYIEKFKDYGWCREEFGFKKRFINLVFTAPRKFNKDDKKALLISFYVKGDQKQIEEDLYLLLLKHKQSQFDRIKKLSSEINAPKSSLEYRMALKIVKQNNYVVKNLPTQSAKFQVSVKKIAEWFNCSVGKASKIINRLKLKKIIVVEYSKQVLAKTTNKFLVNALLEKHKGSYYTGKFVVRVGCNGYCF